MCRANAIGFHFDRGICARDPAGIGWVKVPRESTMLSLDAALVGRLRAGDESAFARLVDDHSSALMRLARTFVSSEAVAEEVVQETWLAVLTGIARFEERSSLKTWLFTILMNRAKSRAAHERRSVPFSVLETDEDKDEPSLPPERFLPADHLRWPHHWATPPQSWAMGPEGAALDRETLAEFKRALDTLLPVQRRVVVLRDVHGWSPGEVCEVLELSDANQRVLLHRGRSRLRAILECYFADRVKGRKRDCM